MTGVQTCALPISQGLGDGGQAAAGGRGDTGVSGSECGDKWISMTKCFNRRL